MVSADTAKLFHRPVPDANIQLSDVLLAFLSLQHSKEEEVSWDQVLRDGPFAFSGKEIRDSFDVCLRSEFIKYVIDQVPQDHAKLPELIPLYKGRLIRVCARLQRFERNARDVIRS